MLKKCKLQNEGCPKIKPKFCKRCFCLRPARGRQVQGIKRAAVYVILQEFDNAAQVKAALPQGPVFAEYNGGIPLILIHQQGEC